MKYLALLLVASLLFASFTTASPVAPLVVPPEQAACEAIDLGLIYVGSPPPPPFTFRITITGATGQYLLYFGGHTSTATYKGCPFETSGEFQFGPFTVDINETFETDSYFDMVGWWKVISATQTSNVVHFQ